MSVCPRCEKRLVRTRAPAGVLFVCPSCQGRAVGLPVVRKVKRDSQLKDLWRCVVQGAGSVGVKCPICRRSTLEVSVPADGQEVRLDVCKGCQFLWFDAQEMQRLPSRPKEVSDEKHLPEELREQIAMHDMDIAARRNRTDGRSSMTDPGEMTPEQSWQWIPGLLGLPVECSGNPVRTLPWITPDPHGFVMGS